MIRASETLTNFPASGSFGDTNFVDVRSFRNEGSPVCLLRKRDLLSVMMYEKLTGFRSGLLKKKMQKFSNRCSSSPFWVHRCFHSVDHYELIPSQLYISYCESSQHINVRNIRPLFMHD